MARQAVRTGRAGLAFELALAAIQANPDYEPARRLFGYQKFHDQWRTLYEVKKLASGCVWSDQFGWLPKASLNTATSKGERLCDGRWISAADDARRHHDIHIRLERRDRALHDPHQPQHGGRRRAGREARAAVPPLAAAFLRYYASEADVVALFDGREAGPPPRRGRRRRLLPRPRRLQPPLTAVLPNIG